MGRFSPVRYRFWLVGNNLPNPNRMALLCCADKDKGENRRDEDFARGGGPKSNYLRSGGPTPVNESTKEKALQLPVAVPSANPIHDAHTGPALAAGVFSSPFFWILIL